MPQLMYPNQGRLVYVLLFVEYLFTFLDYKMLQDYLVYLNPQS